MSPKIDPRKVTFTVGQLVKRVPVTETNPFYRIMRIDDDGTIAIGRNGEPWIYSSLQAADVEPVFLGECNQTGIAGVLDTELPVVENTNQLTLATLYEARRFADYAVRTAEILKRDAERTLTQIDKQIKELKDGT